MTAREQLHEAFVTVDANANFTEAVVTLRDRSRLCFCHRVGERWAKALGPDGKEQEGGSASQLLGLISLFRLNAKHLDIQFADGTRWELPFKDKRGEMQR